MCGQSSRTTEAKRRLLLRQAGIKLSRFLPADVFRHRRRMHRVEELSVLLRVSHSGYTCTSQARRDSSSHLDVADEG